MELIQQNIKPSELPSQEKSTNFKLLTGKEKIVAEAENIMKQIKEMKKTGIKDSDEKLQILLFDLEDVERKIKEYNTSIKRCLKSNKESALRNIAGNPVVDNVLKFKKKNQQGGLKLNEEEQKLVSESFIASLENFRRNRGYEHEARV